MPSTKSRSESQLFPRSEFNAKKVLLEPFSGQLKANKSGFDAFWTENHRNRAVLQLEVGVAGAPAK